MLMKFPKKKYSIIYADPPWPYKDKASSGKRGAIYKYKIMTLKDIKHLPIPKKFSNDNKVCLM